MGIARSAVLLFCLLLSACQAPSDDVIRFGLAAAPDNLDPRFATDATSERINRLLYDRLVDFDAAARPVPALADWQQLSPRHYRFRLRDDDRLFHHGERLTATDVAATYASIIDPRSTSPHRGTLAMIKRIEVVDADRVDFYLHRADALFPGYLSIGILPATAIAAERPFHNAPLGSGPFRFDAWPDPGRLELVRLRDGQRIRFEQVKDPTMRVLKLLRNEVDLVQNDLAPELLQYLRERNDVQVQTRPGSSFAYIGFQLEDIDTGNSDVRRAIALSIDRQAIIKHLFRGAARPAASVLPPEHWAGGKGLEVIGRDLAEARRLLQRAGYSAARPLTLSYKTSSDPFRLRIATVVQQQLAEAGIEVKIQSYDWGTFYGDIKAGRFQMYSLSWVGVKLPDIFRYAFHSESLPPGGANRGRLQDPRVDTLITRATQEAELPRQAEYYRTLQQHLVQLLPYVPLWYEDQFSVVRADINGYQLATDGNYDALVNVTRASSAELHSASDG